MGKNIVQIAVAKPFYVGDIISTDLGNPKEVVTGFVENLTLFHVVIRDFGAKQVWIHHSDFQKYTIHNWTRRQTKPVFLHFAINANTNVGTVKKFVAFVS